MSKEDSNSRNSPKSIRSFLFVPGNHPDKIRKVFGYGADAVILDLEDACADRDKPAARESVVQALKAGQGSLGYIRINAIDTAYCFRDLDAVVGPWLDGVVLPKLENPEELYAIDWALSEYERERGLEVGAIDLMPIIETGFGMKNLDKICSAPGRMKRFAFGAGDFTRDVGIKWSADEIELGYVRGHMILTARAHSLEAPIDTVHIQLDDMESYAQSVATGVKFGFQGKLLIHPKQVKLANQSYMPSAAELAKAVKVIAAFEAAEAEGSASIQVDGYFVDYPIVEKAYAVVAEAKTYSS
ncbi:MAG: CoA ester lyase [Porticoccaceae bacterium]|nr:CoA ester lyase [Porticoccaceae bacterium]